MYVKVKLVSSGDGEPTKGRKRENQQPGVKVSLESYNMHMDPAADQLIRPLHFESVLRYSGSSSSNHTSHLT